MWHSSLHLFKYFLPSFMVTYLIWNIWNPPLFNYFCVVCFLLIISWEFGYFLFERFNQETIDPKNKIVLVTGCDTGFGNRLAYKLDQLGFNVFAGVLFSDGDGAKQLQANCSKRLTIVQMDVTKMDQVNDVVEQIRKTGLPLWGVVNNAGIGVDSPFDWGNDVDICKKIFEVNLFGLVRVTKSCIPLLRQSKGRIVNVASILGRTWLPFTSHYTMTKHSVRVFSDTLRRELFGSKIKVITIEPSFFNTPIINKNACRKMRQQLFDDTPEDIRQYYGDNFQDFLDFNHDLGEWSGNSDLDQVVDSMINGIYKKHPKIYYRCGHYYELLLFWGSAHLPEILVDGVYAIYFALFLRKFKTGPYQLFKNGKHE